MFKKIFNYLVPENLPKKEKDFRIRLISTLVSLAIMNMIVAIFNR